MGKDLVNDLFRFIKSDESTSFEKLKEATDAAYANVGKENSDILKEHDELMQGSSFTSRMPQLPEGKLPADPSQATPDQIQTLAEEKKEEVAIKTANAGVTEDPEKSRIQQDMDKATPDVDKKSDFKVAAKVETAKKVEPTITGVEKDSDKELKDEKNNPKVGEGKLPADPSQATPDQIQTLAEERTLVTVSDENVAKDIASKYPGGRIVPDNEKKQFVVMVQEKQIKEETTTEPKGAAISAGEVPGVKDEKDSKLTGVSKSDPKEPSIKSAEANVGKEPKDPQVGDKGASTAKQDAPTDQKIDPGTTTVTNQDAAKVSGGNKTTEPEKPVIKDTNSVAGTDAKKEDKLTPESKIKEDTEVTVKSEDQTATISMTPTGTNVSTSATPTETPADVLPATTEEPADNTEEATEDEEPEISDEESEEMAERIFVSEYLSGLGEAKLTEKQKLFISETKAKKISKKNKEKIEKKLKALRDKKEKK
jgi:hypothetical protein